MTLPKVLIFDINETLLDMDEMKQGLAPVLNGDETLVDLWFATLLHHSLVDIASGQFHDFIDIGAAALVMVAHSKDIEISQSDAKQTIKKYITALPPHADVKPALNALKDKGFTLVALSNSSINGLAEQLRFANIKDCFDGISFIKADAKIAGAVFFPVGSRIMPLLLVLIWRSCSATKNRCSSLQTTSGSEISSGKRKIVS